MCKKCLNAPSQPKTTVKNSKLRKKIWDLEGRFHCSVIGTCLSLKELDKIIRKTKIASTSEASDYTKHCFFVELASKPSPTSKLISKLLDKKFHHTINTVKRMSHHDEYLAFWQESVNIGDISGAYWALLTHPETSQDLRYLIYGDVHMLSHIEGFSFRKERRQFQYTVEQMKNMERTTQKEIMLRKKASTEKKDLEVKFDLARSELTLLQNQLNIAKDNFRILTKKHESTPKPEVSSKKVRSLQDRNEILHYLNADLQTRNDSLTKNCLDLEQEKQELQTALNLALTQCEGSDISLPEKINLKGKTVVYLGGPRQKQINRFKSVVETSNGQFIHHDGGQEDGDSRLAEVLCKGDVVMCPIDCISHQACLKAKKICKFQGKNFVPLRSSGISSFMIELQGVSVATEHSKLQQNTAKKHPK